MTTVQIPEHPGTAIKVLRDDSPTPAVIVTNSAWEQELHIPVEVAREVAAAILAAIPD